MEDFPVKFLQDFSPRGEKQNLKYFKRVVIPLYRAYIPLALIPLVGICFIVAYHFFHQPAFSTPDGEIKTSFVEKSDAQKTGPLPKRTDGGATGQTTAKKQALEVFRRGYEAYHAHRYDQAISFFDQAIKLDPNCYQALSFKGAALAFKGDYRQAMPWLDRAIKLNPDYEDAYFNKAISLELAGVYDQALQYYDRAAAVNPRDPWTYYGKASIYGRLKNVTACVDNLKKAIALDPTTKEHARTEPDFNNVRSAPAFAQLIAP